ncbi:MAG: rod shape-determining protein MreD [Limnochordaceae bacterium]|nr:rod shape-determining protein MreD [Limnochordaceae bacterium]
MVALLLEVGAAVVLQALPTPAGRLWVRYDLSPHFLGWLTVDTALRDGPWAGAGIGFVVGGATDLLAGRTLGAAAVAWLFCGYGGGLLGRQVFRERWEVPAAFVPAGTLAGITLEMLFVQFWEGLGHLPGLWLHSALPAAFVNGVLALVIYGGAKRWVWRWPSRMVASWRSPVGEASLGERETGGE